MCQFPRVGDDGELGVPGGTLWALQVQGHQLNMTVFFGYFVKSDLSIVCYCIHVHTGQVTFSKVPEKTCTCFTGHPVQISKLNRTGVNPLPPYSYCGCHGCPVIHGCVFLVPCKKWLVGLAYTRQVTFCMVPDKHVHVYLVRLYFDPYQRLAENAWRSY